MAEHPPYSSPYYANEIDEGLAGGRGAIRFDAEQFLTESQKQQARMNLGLDAADDESEGVFWAEYGTTTYQEIIENYNLGKVCVVVDSNNDLFYLGQVGTNLLTFYRSFRGVNSPQDGARIEFKHAMVTSTNTWSSFYYYGENTANRTTVINEQSTDVQYPTAKAVYTAAQGYANAAKDAAKDYTDEQLEPVEEAAGKAEEYALGAYVTPTASGAIASFDDGADGLPVKSLIVDIDPVQDLNGYDAPWPPGGGQNLARISINPPSYAAVTATEQDGNILLNGTADAVLWMRLCVAELVAGETYTLSCASELQADVWDFVNDNGVVLKHVGQTKVTFTAVSTGRHGVFISNGSGTVFNNVLANIQIELGSATAYAPYSNICPISGRTGANVTCRNNNLANLRPQINRDSSYTVTASDTTLGGYSARSFEIVSVGDKIWGWTINLYNVRNVIKPSTKYVLTWISDQATIFNNVIAMTTGDYALSTSSYEIVTDMGNGLYKHRWNLTTKAADDPAWKVTDQVISLSPVNVDGDYKITIAALMFEEGSTATSYAPSAANSYSISFPAEAGTVYGAKLDVTTGTLTVDRAMVTFNGSENWSQSDLYQQPGRYRYFVNGQYGIALPVNNDAKVNAVSSHYPIISAQQSYVSTTDLTGLSAQVGTQGFQVRDESYTEQGLDAFKGFLAEQYAAGTPVQVCYELASPLVYQLSPIEVKTLLGVNNIYSDAGSVDVSYRADPTLIYNKILAAIISSSGAV